MSEKLKRNGKNFSKWIAAAALTALFIFNIGFNVDVNFKDGWMPNVEISAVVQQAMAEGGSGSSTTCTVTSNCYNVMGTLTGSVSCTGAICSRGSGWVKCDGVKTEC